MTMRFILTSLVSSLVFMIGHGQSIQFPTLSPISKISQEIGLTQIELSYSRPSAKGRTVFGELVPYGQTWRTGANASTKLTFTEDVIVAGNLLPAGTYALYTIPKRDIWTMIIHKKTDLRSIAGDRVKPENDAFRFDVKPSFHPTYMETFTIQFGHLTTNSCDIQILWENTMVSFSIVVDVDSKIERQITEVMKDPENVNHRILFRCAEYYLHNGKNLDRAQDWIDRALIKSENNFRYGLLKSKIYASQGNIPSAKSMVEQAHEWAKVANNANYMEQTMLYRQSLD